MKRKTYKGLAIIFAAIHILGWIVIAMTASLFKEELIYFILYTILVMIVSATPGLCFFCISYYRSHS